MVQAPRKIVVAVIALVVLVGGVALGRHILAGGGTSRSSSLAGRSPSAAHTGNGATRSSSDANSTQGTGGTGGTRTGAPYGAVGSVGSAGTGAVSEGPVTGSTLPPVPVYAIAPQIVRTATIDVHVGKDALSSALTDIAAMAGTEGGFVESSSMQGGRTGRAPVSGTIVIHVLNSDFGQAMAALSGYGKVTNQKIQGRDVTNQVSTNAASSQILQDEVTLLQGKLAQATDINTFLQIQNQLFPVEERLQQIQNQQSVLTNSAALATITAHLSTSYAPLVSPSPSARPSANAATVAWRYLRHNSLAVLDGLAVGGGWALPVLALLALLWLAGTRIARRIRHAANPA